jgi:hypothetical protein
MFHQIILQRGNSVFVTGFPLTHPKPPNRSPTHHRSLNQNKLLPPSPVPVITTTLVPLHSLHGPQEFVYTLPKAPFIHTWQDSYP